MMKVYQADDKGPVTVAYGVTRLKAWPKPVRPERMVKPSVQAPAEPKPAPKPRRSRKPKE